MKKTLGLIISAILTTIFFSSCFSPLYYEIMNDVAPEEATVSGNINSIARYTVGSNEYIALAADNGLRYKLASNQTHGSWSSFDLTQVIDGFTFHKYDYDTTTHNGYQIIKVVSDSTYLYIICAAYENNTSYGTSVVSEIKIWGIAPQEESEGVWSTSSSTYCEVSIPDDTFPFYYDSDDIMYSAFSVFSTNTPQTANRHVFIRSGKEDTDYSTLTYYELSNGTISSYTSPTPADTGDSSDQISSVVMFNGSLIFLTAQVATTNETYVDAADYIYYGDSTYLYYSDDGSTFTKALNASYPIVTLTPTADSLLIGRGFYSTSSTSTTTSGGMVRTSLSDGVPGTSLIDFDSNASFKLTSAYTILASINATPSNTEEESILYASMTFYGTGSSSSSVSYDDVGLWAYYPSRGNWNRE